jgi:hypothetical protein
MKIKYTLTFLLIFPLLSIRSQTWQWAKQCQDTPGDYSDGTAMCTDAAGNIVVGGLYQGTLIAGTNSLSGANDYYMKYDASGNLLWAKTPVGNNASPFSASADAAGNYYFTGMFNNTVAYGTSTLSSFVNKMYLLKLDANGNMLWARQPQLGRSIGNSVSNDNSGNAYVCGSYDSTMVIGNYTLTAATGTNNAFIAKFDANGNVLWAKNSNGTMSDAANGISTDAAGNSYITGNFISPLISFGTLSLTNTGYSDMFLVKYNSSGNEVWARSSVGTGTFDSGIGVSQDGSGGIYVAGNYDSPSIVIGSATLTNVNSGDLNMFIAKYDAAGNALWAKGSKGVENQTWSVSSYSAGVFVAGALDYTTGIFGTYTLNAPAGSVDPGFLMHYDVNGNATFANAFTTGGDDYFGVAVDKFCNAYISGDIAVNTFTLGSSTLTLSGGIETSFIAKLAYTCQVVPDGIRGEFTNSSGIKIYPNPANGNFKINTAKESSSGILTIFNSLGMKVHEQEIPKNETEVSLNLPNGIYHLVLLENGQRIYNGSLIIEK